MTNNELKILFYSLSQREYKGIRYLELFPDNKEDESPVLIYLHGAGERGVDLLKLTRTGLLKSL